MQVKAAAALLSCTGKARAAGLDYIVNPDFISYLTEHAQQAPMLTFGKPQTLCLPQEL
jgi:hypothetical protein